MSGSLAQSASLFCSRLRSHRFDDATLRILESVLVCRDAKSSMEVRSSLKEFLRSEFPSVIREIATKTIEQKLSVLDFYVRSFAVIGDTESCLALRYEALLLRELHSVSQNWLQVSCVEWLYFAEHSLDAGYFSIAAKASENALFCLQRDGTSNTQTADAAEDEKVLEKIENLQKSAVKSASSHPVQDQAVEYLARRMAERNRRKAGLRKETECPASTSFRNAIKIRNARKLRECQSLRP